MERYLTSLRLFGSELLDDERGIGVLEFTVVAAFLAILVVVLLPLIRL